VRNQSAGARDHVPAGSAVRTGLSLAKTAYFRNVIRHSHSRDVDGFSGQQQTIPSNNSGCWPGFWLDELHVALTGGVFQLD